MPQPTTRPEENTPRSPSTPDLPDSGRDFAPESTGPGDIPAPPRPPLPVAEALGALFGPTPTVQEVGKDGPAGPPDVPGFEALEEVGRGGMGVVYKARHTRLGRLVALKMVLAGPHAGAEARARFRAEAEAVARLQHPNIVQIFEVGEHQGVPFCVLEFVDGGSLARKLKGGPLPPAEAAGLVEALAAAMHLVHSRSVIHRDLKPANVLLTPDGTPKVTDFGLARRLDLDSGQTRTGAVMGTPSYMAPEQAEGLAQSAGPAVDVYALGAILYECLTGRPPFRGRTVLETLEQVRSREPVPPSRLRPRVPRDLETVCLKCLAKAPEGRYASARELAEDLGRFRRGEPVLARPVGLPVRLAKWARRRPAVAGLLLALLLLSTAGSGTLVAFRLQTADARAEKAQERERLTRTSLEKLEDATAENLLRPVGYDRTGMSAAELNAFRDLASTASERIRLRFLENALESPERAARLDRWGAVAVHSVVGLNRKRGERVERLLLERLRDGRSDRRVREVCIRLGAALETRGAAFCGEAAKKALEMMGQTSDPLTLAWQAEAVSSLAARLPPAEAEAVSEAAARLVTGALGRASDSGPLRALTRALKSLADRLGPGAAAAAGRDVCAVLPRVVEMVNPFVIPDLIDVAGVLAARMEPAEAAAVAREALGALSRAVNPDALTLGARAAVPLVGRLGPREAVAVVRPLVAEMTGGKPLALPPRVALLSALAERLSPEDAAAAIRSLLGATGGRRQNPNALPAAKAVSSLARRLAPRDAAAVARELTGRMARRPANKYSGDPFAEPLAAAAARLDPADAASVARELIAVMEKSSGLIVVRAYGEVMTVLAARMGPAEAGASAGLALAALPRASDVHARAYLARGVGSLAARMKPGEAGPVSSGAARELVRGLLAAPPAHIDAFVVRSFDEAVDALAARMAPEEAARFAAFAARGFSEALARAPAPGDLAELLAGVAGRLGPAEAAGAARPVLDAIKKAQPVSLPVLARALSRLAARMEPGEGGRTAAAAVRVLADALTRPGNPRPATGLARAIRSLAWGLKPDEAVAVARGLIARMGGRGLVNISMLPSQAAAVVELCARMEPAEAERVSKAAAEKVIQQITWALGPTSPLRPLMAKAFFDAVTVLSPRMAPKEAAAALQVLLDAMSRHGFDKLLHLPLVEAVEALAARLEPGQAAAAARKTLQAMGGFLRADTVSLMARAVGSLAARMEPEEASRVSAAAARAVLETMAQNLPAVRLPEVYDAGGALGSLAPRLRPGDAAAVARELVGVIALTTYGAPPSPSRGSPTSRERMFRIDALGGLEARLATEDLIDLLKQPTCRGNLQRVVLRELARRLGPAAPQAAPLGLVGGPFAADLLYPGGRRSFADLDEAIRWLSEHHPEFDLASPAGVTRR